jgi:hypothetical protein
MDRCRWRRSLQALLVGPGARKPLVDGMQGRAEVSFPSDPTAPRWHDAGMIERPSARIMNRVMVAGVSNRGAALEPPFGKRCGTTAHILRSPRSGSRCLLYSFRGHSEAAESFRALEPALVAKNSKFSDGLFPIF